MTTQHDLVRIAAKSIGLVLVRFQEGFYVFDDEDGEQLGIAETMHQPWTPREVLGYCAMFQEGLATQEFRI